MTRKQFIDELRERLARLDPAERDAAVAYYEEYFDEAGADREQEVIRELGSPASLASRILADHAVKAARESPYNPRKGLSAIWFVLLAVFAAPLALPAILAIFGVMVAVFVSVFAVGAAAVGLFVGGLAFFADGFFGLFSAPATALVLFGAAFLLWGIVKIVFSIIGAVLSLLGNIVLWLFDRPGFDRAKGDYYGR